MNQVPPAYSQDDVVTRQLQYLPLLYDNHLLIPVTADSLLEILDYQDNCLQTSHIRKVTNIAW